MNRFAFIVDGFTEKLILQKICPDSVIRRTDLNGKTVKLEAIAKRVASIIRGFGSKYYPIIIVIDKEQRSISYVEMIKELKKLIQAENVLEKIIIGVADIQLENWMLADWNVLETDVKKPIKTDGINGVGMIKKIRQSYAKTIDGVELFCKADIENIYRNSDSFKYFIDSFIKDFTCLYLHKLRNTDNE